MRCPPRIAIVPEPARPAGGQVAALAAQAGIVLDEAQRLVLDAFCGRDADSRWSAFQGVCLMPRQNGKTELLIIRILAGLFLFRERRVIFSSHQSRTSSEVFRRLREVIESTPELGGRIARVSNRIGAESLELEGGARVECIARSTGSGRGYVADSIVLDECQYLTTAMMEDVMPAVSTVRNAQVIYALSEGMEESGHVGSLRQRALNREDSRLAWLEWSMAEGDDPADRAVWAACNPASPERITLDHMKQEWLSLGREAFARQRLGKSSWPVDPSGRFAVVSKAAWEACERPQASTEGGRVSLGVATDRLGTSAAVASCSTGPDGLPVVEVLGWKPGERGGWVSPHISALASRHRVDVVTWDDESPARELGLTGCRVRGENPRAGDYPRACMAFLGRVEEHGLAHLGQPELTRAVGSAVAKNTRAGWYFSPDAHGGEVLAAVVWALSGYGRHRLSTEALLRTVSFGKDY